MLDGVVTYWGDGGGEQIKAEQMHRAKHEAQSRDSRALERNEIGGEGETRHLSIHQDEDSLGRVSIGREKSKSYVTYFAKEEMDDIDVRSIHYRGSRGIKMGNVWSGLIM